MIQTAEGALNESHSLLQRMRELAVQASNDTNDCSDRSQIQKEINQLTSEINRIGNATEFNTQKILKGADKLEGLGSSILSAEVFKTSGGHTTPATSARVEVEGNAYTLVDGAQYVRYNLNGTKLRVGICGTSDPSLIKSPPGETGGYYQVVVYDTYGARTGSDVVNYQKIGLQKLVDAGFIDADDFSVTTEGNYLIIESTKTGSGQSILVEEKSPLLVEQANVKSTGGDVEYESANAEITFGELTKEQVLGKGITINNQTIMFTDGASSSATDFSVDVSEVANNQSLVAAIADQLGDELNGVTLSANGDTLTVTATAQAEAGNGIVISDGAELGAGANPGKFAANLHIGANAGQAIAIGLSDMRAANLGLTGNGDGFTSEFGVINGSSCEAALDVSLHESADKAITVIDNAIETVSAERSMLGAMQNRLEHTIANLGTSAENLQAAESRIRDLDMAEEIMAFTKNNILQQAATAILAQANMAPQSVLQLLG